VRWRRWIGLLLLFLSSCVGVVLVAHRVRLAGLRRAEIPDILTPVHEAIPPALLRRVGFFDDPHESWFIHFSREKPPGVRRLCALGDSFTAGSEVDPTHDYPSLLQARLDDREPGRFEVLNFGQAWFGFHQVYLVWEGLARDYDCDVVLLGPATFYPPRDTSFNHARELNPYYLHARYVLHGDDVRLVEVVGESVEERFEEYHRLIPDARYLWYDDVAPSAALALLPTGWVLDNPFYYRDDSKEHEAFETYRILLGKLAGEVPRVLLAGTARVRNAAAPHEITTFRPLKPSSFPYRASRRHFGPLGNDLIARQFAAHVESRPLQSLPALRTSERPPSDRGGAATPVTPLDRYETVEVEIEETALGHFVTGGDRTKRSGSPHRLRDDGVKGLIVAGRPPPFRYTQSDSPLDGCFLPLNHLPVDGAPVVLESDGPRRAIGTVRLWDPEVPIGEIVLGDGFDHPTILLGSEQGLGSFRLPTRQDPTEGTEVRVRIGEEDVLVGPTDRMRSERGPCYLVRANPGGFVDLDDIAERGLVEIVARATNRPPRRVPIARWQRISLAPPG